MIGVQGGLMQFPGGQPIDGSDFSKRVTNCVLLTVSVVSICVLVVCGVMIVREYALAKGYEAAQCQVTSVAIANNMTCRFCNDKTQGKKGVKACVWATFPCLQISVQYKYGDDIEEGVIHRTSIQARGAYKECSYSICKKTFEENKLAVDEYAVEWEGLMAAGSKFDCYYDTDNLRNLIQEKKHDKSAVIHSMLWPSLIIMICGIIFLKLETRRRGISFCGTAEFEKAKMERMAESVPLKKKSAVKTVVDAQFGNGTNGGVNSQRRCMVKCKITRPSGQENSYISSSMSSIDRLTGVEPAVDTSPVGQELTNGRIGVSVSADTINPPHRSSSKNNSGNAHESDVSFAAIDERVPHHRLPTSGSSNSDKQQLLPSASAGDTSLRPESSTGNSRGSVNSDGSSRRSGAETPV